MIFRIVILYISLLLPAWGFTSTRYKITLMNIGAGDSILVEDVITRQGLLIDAGNPLSSEKILSVLKLKEITKLNALVITHPHLDHFGGAFGIIPFIKPEKYYDNGQDLSEISVNEHVYRFYEKLIRKDNYRQLSAGDRFQFSEINFQILSSSLVTGSGDWNTNSLVLMLNYKGFSMLLMGDANLATEKVLAEKICGRLKADILKAGHHGNQDASGEPLLKCVNPEYIIISSGQEQKIIDPMAERFNRYSKKVYLTYSHGDVEIRLTEDGRYSIGSWNE